MNFERLELFKKLEPDFKIDKLVYLTEAIMYNELILREGTYVVSNPRFSYYSGNMVVVLVDLEYTMYGHHKDISMDAFDEGFSCWRIKLVDYENFEEFKPLCPCINFLWKGGYDGN